MIEYEKRAMIEAEDKYTFRQSTQISMQTGLIGTSGQTWIQTATAFSAAGLISGRS